MRISIGTIEVNDEARRAIRERKGRNGLATRNECREELIALAIRHLEDITSEWRDAAMKEQP